MRQTATDGTTQQTDSPATIDERCDALRQQLRFVRLSSQNDDYLKELHHTVETFITEHYWQEMALLCAEEDTEFKATLYQPDLRQFWQDKLAEYLPDVAPFYESDDTHPLNAILGRYCFYRGLLNKQQGKSGESWFRLGDKNYDDYLCGERVNLEIHRAVINETKTQDTEFSPALLEQTINRSKRFASQHGVLGAVSQIFILYRLLQYTQMKTQDIDVTTIYWQTLLGIMETIQTTWETQQSKAKAKLRTLLFNDKRIKQRERLFMPSWVPQKDLELPLEKFLQQTQAILQQHHQQHEQEARERLMWRT